MFLLMIAFLVHTKYLPNTVGSCRVKSTWLFIDHRLTERHWHFSRAEWYSCNGLSSTVIGHDPRPTWLGNAKTTGIFYNSTKMCPRNGTIFNRNVVHQMSIQWVAYVVNSWLLESDTLGHVLNIKQCCIWYAYILFTSIRWQCVCNNGSLCSGSNPRRHSPNAFELDACPIPSPWYDMFNKEVKYVYCTWTLNVDN